MDRIAIITVTYNSSAYLRGYLRSMARQLSDSRYFLVIVDNASSDNTCEIIREFIDDLPRPEAVKLLELNENIGFGRGCNRGAQESASFNPDYFWILNPDTERFDKASTALVETFKQKPDATFVGSVLEDEHGEPRSGAFRFPTLLNVFLTNIRLGLLDGLFPNHVTVIPLSDDVFAAQWLTGASFMVKADAFERLGGFDPKFFLYFEEVDLFYRARQMGYGVYSCPASRVMHISGASTGVSRTNPNRRKPGYWFESRRYFYRKNFGALYFAAADICFIGGELLCRLKNFILRRKQGAPEMIVRDILRHSVINREG